MGRRAFIAPAAAVAVLFAAGVSSAVAQTPPNPGSVRFSLGYFASTSDINIQHNTDNPQGSLITTNNSWKNGWGVGAAYEYRFNPMIGAHVGAKYFRPNVELATTGREDRVSFVPVTAGLNFHFGSPDKVDFYFGPQAAYIWYGKFSVPIQVGMGAVQGNADIEFKNELTWGGTAGVDFALSPNMALSVAVDYLAAEAKVDTDPNALFFGVGNGYKTNPRPVFITGGVTFRF